MKKKILFWTGAAIAAYGAYKIFKALKSTDTATGATSGDVTSAGTMAVAGVGVGPVPEETGELEQ